MVARRGADRMITSVGTANKLHIIAAGRSNAGNNNAAEIRAQPRRIYFATRLTIKKARHGFPFISFSLPGTRRNWPSYQNDAALIINIRVYGLRAA